MKHPWTYIYIYMLKTCAQDMLKSAVLVIHKGNRWTHSLKMFIFTLETNHHVCLGHLGLLRLGCSFVANRCQPYDFTRINFTHCSGQRQSDNHRSSLKVVVNNQQWLQLWLQSSNMTSQHCLASSRRQTNTKISWDLGKFVKKKCPCFIASPDPSPVRIL